MKIIIGIYLDRCWEQYGHVLYGALFCPVFRQYGIGFNET